MTSQPIESYDAAAAPLEAEPWKRYVVKDTARDAGIDIVRFYMNDMGEYALLTGEQEVELAQAIEAGKTAQAALTEAVDNGGAVSDDIQATIQAGAEARERLVTSNLRLVVSIAKRYQRPGIELLDLIQEGTFGLFRAADKFDWRMGNKFSTYATFWVRQMIKRAIGNQVRLIRQPIYAQDQVADMRRARHQLQLKMLQTDISPQQIAEAMGIDVEKVKELQALESNTDSLDRPLGEDGVTLGETVSDPQTSNFVDAQIFEMDRDLLRQVCFEDLNAREALIIELRYGFDGHGEQRSLQEVGDYFGLTRERIRQIEFKALSKMRQRRDLINELR